MVPVASCEKKLGVLPCGFCSVVAMLLEADWPSCCRHAALVCAGLHFTICYLCHFHTLFTTHTSHTYSTFSPVLLEDIKLFEKCDVRMCHLHIVLPLMARRRQGIMSRCPMLNTIRCMGMCVYVCMCLSNCALWYWISNKSPYRAPYCVFSAGLFESVLLLSIFFLLFLVISLMLTAPVLSFAFLFLKAIQQQGEYGAKA